MNKKKFIHKNRKGKNLFGGIVTNTDTRNYRGRWVYFDKMSKELNDNDFSNWKDLAEKIKGTVLFKCDCVNYEADII